ncbi:neuromedin-B receptor-like [Saccostrea echinata]|uniref:neuromedin-B receptor-like n=1 Tax=Saccostrea echinata TaxID=191078 RepID=UPI002A7FEF96|nr:neuromedin-B receptor-like [Saccostrea echinata]
MNSSGRAVDTQHTQYNPVDVGTLPSIVFLVILMVIGTVANGHVFGIFLLRYKSNSKSTYVTFVLALASIDLLICVCDLPLEILDLRYPYDFYSATGCKLYKLVSATLILSSVFTLTLLSRDRFKRIRYPLSSQWSNSTCRRYIAAVILLSFILSAPVIYIHGLRKAKLSDGTEVERCFFEDDVEEKFNLPLIYLSVLYLIFIVCLFILIMSYTCIWISVYQSRRFFYQAGNKREDASLSNITEEFQTVSRSSASTAGPEQVVSTNSVADSIEIDLKNEKKVDKTATSHSLMEFSGRLRSMNVVPKIQRKRKVLVGNHRSSVIMFIITSIFIFVFLPYLVLGVFLCLKENFKANMNEVELSVYRLSMRLIFVNNVVNCFVYGIFDPRFKKACKEFYKKCFTF